MPSFTSTRTPNTSISTTTIGSLTLVLRKCGQTSPLTRNLITFFVTNTYLILLPVLTAFPAATLLLYPSQWRLLMALSLLYLLTYLDRSEKKGGRPWLIAFFRSLTWIWDSVLDYFPMAVGREGPPLAVSSSTQYLFCVHPHGAVGWNRIPMCTGKLWDNLFPGLDLRILSASVLFKIPILRDICLGMGMIDASRSVAESLLKEHRSLCVVPGGIAEQMQAKWGQDVIWLKDRKGFIRLALTTGSHLVPVYGFGEARTYRCAEVFLTFRKWLAKRFKFSPILPYGRLLMLPYATPITLVVGRPIPVELCENPTEDQVQALMKQYVDALTALYYKYRDRFGGARTLTIVQ